MSSNNGDPNRSDTTLDTSSTNSCTSPTMTNLTNGSLNGVFDRCPHCSFQYDFLRRNPVWPSKVPLILKCQHTVCEDCIHKLLTKGNVCCPLCKEISPTFCNENGSLGDCFTPHYSLIGYLLWSKNQLSCSKGMPPTLKPTGMTLRSKDVMGLDVNQDDINKLNQATEELRADFCDCSLPNLRFDECEEHENTFNTLVCVECETKVCCYCFLEKHKGHSNEYLHKLSDEQMAELNMLNDKAQLVVNFSRASLLKVKELGSFNHANVAQAIKSYFANLHAHLFNIESKLLKSLATQKIENSDLDGIKKRLQQNLLTLSHLLSAFRDFKDGQSINMKRLRDEMEHWTQVPCQLISDGNTLEPIHFATSDVLDNIEEYFTLEQSPDIEYDLRPIENFEEALSISRCPSADMACSSSMRRSEATSKSMIRIKHKSNVKTKEFVKQPKVVEPKLLRVKVTHVEDMDHIYIQRGSDELQLKAINKSLKSYQPNVLLRFDQIMIGQLYAVMYKGKSPKSWRRGRVVEVSQKGESDLFYKVFFIDYGNSALVARDMLAELDPSLAKRQRCVTACKLTNPDNLEYGHSTHKDLCRLVQDKDTYVVYITKPNKPDANPEIDILIPNSCGQTISVREHISATTMTTSSIAGSECAPVKAVHKFFRNSKVFRDGQSERVLVTHVHDPFKMYVQLEKNAQILKKMLDSIALFYGKKQYSCIPVANTDVIVHHDVPKQGTWHRGTVLQLFPETKEAEIYFVDWGGSALVPWNNVKMLMQEFTKIECQAIPVKLADIEPGNGCLWRMEAIDFIRNELNTNGNAYNMTVANAAASPLLVALFLERPMAHICLNAQLVEKGLALTTGTLSGTVFWPQDQHLHDTGNPDEDDLTWKDIKKAEQVLLEDDDGKSKVGLTPAVKFVRCDSPDSIKLKFCRNIPTEEDLRKKIAYHYNCPSNRIRRESWSPAEICVCYDPITQYYHRAQVRSQINANMYSVHLVDLDRGFKVHICHMYELDRYFMKTPGFIYKCRLANVKPLGGGNEGKWSNYAKELLTTIFNKYRSIYCKKIANDTSAGERSIIVYLWYLVTTPGGALEPTKQHYISINRMLVECGAAAMDGPDRSNSFVQSGNESDALTESEPDFVMSLRKSDLQSTTSSTSSSTTLSGRSIENKADRGKSWVELMKEDEELARAAEAKPDAKQETSQVSSWLVPEPLQHSKFNAVLLCLDTQGYLSIRDEEINEVYKELEASIQQKMAAANVAEKESDDSAWKVNDMCMLKDKDIWYRGTVLQVVDQKTIRVEMIDFNSAHDVNPNCLSRWIVHADINRLANRIQLYDVVPKCGTWTMEDYNILIDNVTDRIQVEIIDCGQWNTIPYAEVTMDDGSNLNDIAANYCPNLIRCRKTVVPREEAEEDYEYDETRESIYTYPPVNTTKKRKSNYMIVSVLKYNTVVLNVLNKEATDFSPELQDLYKNIQVRADSQPEIEEVTLNQACICFCSARDMWCRAFVYNVEFWECGYFLAFLVDFGTIIMVGNKKHVKKMRKQWFHLPVFNVPAEIAIELNDEHQEKYVQMQMDSYCGKQVQVEVIAETPLKIHLYENNRLCYQNFVKKGIVKVVK